MVYLQALDAFRNPGQGPRTCRPVCNPKQLLRQIIVLNLTPKINVSMVPNYQVTALHPTCPHNGLALLLPRDWPLDGPRWRSADSRMDCKLGSWNEGRVIGWLSRPDIGVTHLSCLTTITVCGPTWYMNCMCKVSLALLDLCCSS